MHHAPSILFVLVSLPPSAVAGLRYVDSTLTTGANDGSSWANAYRGPLGLQRAIAPALPGDRIWVHAGRYVPATVGHQETSFALEHGVGIYGGFAGTETQLDQRDPVANLTVLSGDLGNNDASGVYFDNSRYVVSSSGAAGSGLLDGFTVRDGRSYSFGGWNWDGGGLCILPGAAPSIRNCIVCRNVGFSGAGVVVWQASPRFESVHFLANHALIGGGGALLFECSDVQFESCEFRDNVALTGGGLCIGASFGTLLRNCLVCNNHAIQSVMFHLGAGGIEAESSPMELVNCTAAGNTSESVTTGGIRVLPSGLALSNCIVYSNLGTGGGGLTIDNIAFGNAHHCCIEGGFTGAGNISADPLFASLPTGDLHIAQNSPCADAGNNSLVPAGTTTDIEGNPRLADDPVVPDTGAGSPPIVDIGAYEIPNTLYGFFCAGDGTLGSACPCGNTGAAGRGCLNSDLFSQGALLVAAGTSNPDTLVLTASDMLASVTCVFLQGNQQNTNGVVFGDGVRCVAGSLKRLFIKSASAGSASAPGAGDPSLSARSAALGDTIAPGTQRYYQVYYHDPDLNFCPAPQGNTWNVSSGVIVNW